MKKILLILSFFLISFTLLGSHKVFVIHGYASSRLAMSAIVKSLKNENYPVENYKYRSMIDDLDTIGKELYEKIKLEKFDTVSFVTHSMGALVLRSMLQYSLIDNDFPLIYRIVMFAPPNQGLQMADLYVPFAMLNAIFGPNIEHMKTDSKSYVNRLPMPINSEVGIIAGGRLKAKGYNRDIEGDNDGLINPEKTKLGIEKEFITIKGSHNRLIHEKRNCKLIIEFLKHGAFYPNTTSIQ